MEGSFLLLILILLLFLRLNFNLIQFHSYSHLLRMVFEGYDEFVDYHVLHSVVADLACVLPGYALVGKDLVRLLARSADLSIRLGRAHTEVHKAGEDYAQPKDEIEETYLVGRKRVAEHEHAYEHNAKRPHRDSVRSLKPRNQCFVLFLFDLQRK